MTNITDPSQSQGLLHPSARHTYPDNEGLQSIHQDVYDAPQVWDPASEGLQSVDYDGRNGPQVVEQSPLSPDLRYAHSGHADYEKSKILVSDQPISSTSRRGRRRLIWAIMVAVVIAIAIAVGVGAGVGLTRQSSDDSPENEQENGSEEYGLLLNNYCSELRVELTDITASCLPPTLQMIQPLHLGPLRQQRHQPHLRSQRVA